MANFLLTAAEEPSLWEEIWKYLEDKYFTVDYGNYQHIQMNNPVFSLRTLLICFWVGIMLAAVLMTAGLTFSRQLMSFAGANEDTLEMSNLYFRVLAWFLPVNALTMCINAAQRGTGNTKTTMYVNVTAMSFEHLLGHHCYFFAIDSYNSFFYFKDSFRKFFFIVRFNPL